MFSHTKLCDGLFALSCQCAGWWSSSLGSGIWQGFLAPQEMSCLLEFAGPMCHELDCRDHHGVSCNVILWCGCGFEFILAEQVAWMAAFVSLRMSAWPMILRHRVRAKLSHKLTQSTKKLSVDLLFGCYTVGSSAGKPNSKHVHNHQQRSHSTQGTQGIYIYIYIYTHIHMCVYLCISVYIYIYMCIYVCGIVGWLFAGC